MSCRTVAFTFVAVCLAFSYGFSQDDNPWKMVLKEKDLTIYNRTTDQSKVRELKAEFLVDAPTWRVCEAVCDLEDYRDYMPFTIVSKVLSTKKVNADRTDYVFFTAIQPPLVSVRYYTLDISRQNRFEDKDRWYQVRWKKSDDVDLDWTDPKVRKLFPDEIGAPMKVMVNEGYWILEPIDGGARTKIHYFVHADPAGNLPPFLAEKANYIMFPKLRRAVQKRVKDPRYDAFAPKLGAK